MDLWHFFYRKLKEDLGPVLRELMLMVSKEKKIPDSWTEAHIALILKDQQDPLSMKSYRPISLLNKDYKLYASRLKMFLKEFINEHQVGFMPGRQLRGNVRHILNLIEYYDKNPDHVAWLFFL